MCFTLCSQILSPLFTCLEMDMGWVIDSADLARPKIAWFFNQHSAFFKSSGRAWSQLGPFPSTVHSAAIASVEIYKKKDLMHESSCCFHPRLTHRIPPVWWYDGDSCMLYVGAINAAHRIRHHASSRVWFTCSYIILWSYLLFWAIWHSFILF